MLSLLVTGGAGFIGGNFVHYWRKAHPGDRIVVLDALTYAGNRMTLAALEGTGNYTFVHGNILDQALVESLLREHGTDTLVHFAAETHVDRSILGPDAFIATNVVGTHSLLKACRQVWQTERSVPKHRFHHVSTDEVFGSLGRDDLPFTEKSAYAPNSPYAASKAASDHLVRAYGRTYGLEVTTSNCSNNYGPYQFPEKLIPLVIVSILDGRPIPVYGDGRNVRDWLFAEDHCRAVDHILTAGLPGRTYNVGGRSERENIDIINLICTMTDALFLETPFLRSRFPNCPAASGSHSQSLITYVADRPGHDRRYAIDSNWIELALGFETQINLDEGLRRTLHWYVQNEPWWRQVIDGSYQAGFSVR